MVHEPVSRTCRLDGWVDYHVAIAEAVPDLGLVLYIRDPRIAGAHIRRLGERCPNVVGVKYGCGSGAVRRRWPGTLAWTGSPGWPGWPS